CHHAARGACPPAARTYERAMRSGWRFPPKGNIAESTRLAADLGLEADEDEGVRRGPGGSPHLKLHVLDVRGDEPGVAGRVFHVREAVAIRLVRRSGNGCGTSL